MSSNENLIFSERFPHISPEEALAQLREEAGESATTESNGLPSFDELLRQMREESVYIPRPEKIAARQQFIDEAKQLSLDCEIDMDIKEYYDTIDVHMYLYHGTCTGLFKCMLLNLLKLCDRICIFPPESGPHDFKLSLIYRTYDHYISGREVE